MVTSQVAFIETSDPFKGRYPWWSRDLLGLRATRFALWESIVLINRPIALLFTALMYMD